MDDGSPLSRRAVLGIGLTAVLGGCSGTDTGSTTSPSTTSNAGGSTTTGPAGTTDDAGTITPREPPGADAEWRSFGRDLANTGHDPSSAGPGGPVGRVWDADVEGIYTLAQPILADGTLYAASGKRAYAMNARDGTPRWEQSLPYLGHHYPTPVVEGTVVVGCRTLQGGNVGGGEGALLALERADGSERWRLERPLTAPPVALGSSVLVVSSDGDGLVERRAVADGTAAWERSVEESGTTVLTGAPAVADGALYVTGILEYGAGDDSRGLVLSLDPSTGSVRWRSTIASPVSASPVVTDEAVVVAAQDGSVAALAREDGTPLWTADTGGTVRTTPAVDGSRAYVLLKGVVVALDLSDGTEAWRTRVGQALINGLAVGSRSVYVGGKTLTALSIADGTAVWRYEIPDFGGGFGAPVVAGGTVFVGACVKHERGDRYDDAIYALQRR